MAINTKKIEEITFAQSFRGYNTDEVDDFLDEIYNETMHANKLIEQLKQKIKDLENAKPDPNQFNDDSTNIIANAQIAADEIVKKATQKAQQILENAQNMAASTSANATANTNSVDMSVVNNLKALINNSYEKQMNILEDISRMQSTKSEAQAQFIPREKHVSAMPSVSFSGVVNNQPKVEEKERPRSNDIFSEINSIGFNGYANTSTIEYVEPPKPAPQPNRMMDYDQRQRPVVNEQPHNTIEYVENTIARAPKTENMQYQERKPESPDDIIAQILRDNNRN